MSGVEALGIVGGALFMLSPFFIGAGVQRWLDQRSTAEQKQAHTRQIVQARREQINRRGW